MNLRYRIYDLRTQGANDDGRSSERLRANESGRGLPHSKTLRAGDGRPRELRDCFTKPVSGGGVFDGEGDADDAGGRGDDLELAVVVLDDLLGDGQAEAEADAAGGVKRGGNFFRGIGAEAGAVVLHFDGEGAVADGAIGLEGDADLRGLGVGLQGVQHDLGEGVAQGRAVAGDDERFAAVI